MVRGGAGSRKRRSRRIKEPALVQLLEPRTLLAVTSITINPINPTEGVPFGTVAKPAQIATFVVNNFIGIDESSQYSAVIDWGDGAKSAGLGPVTISFVASLGNGNAQYAVNSFHTYAEATTTGNPYSLTVTIDDNTGPGTNQSQSGPVAVNDAPLVNSFTPTTTSATVNVPITNLTVGQFIDSNPLATSHDYAVSVNWGDGKFSGGTVVAFRSAVQLGGTGVEFTVEASHTYTTTGPFTVTTLVSDLEGSTVTETSTVNVTNSTLQQVTAAPINAVEGIPFTGTVASFSDPNPSDMPSQFTATINWGNGSQTAGTVAANGPGAFIVTGVDPVSGKGFAYAEEGTYNVMVSVKGPSGAQFTAFTTANVADAPLTATGLTLGVAPPIFTFPPFSGEVASFTDADPNGMLSDYSATINWGDGTTTPGMITMSGSMPGVFLVNGTHSFAASSIPFQVTVTVKDVGGATASAVTSITVTSTPLTPGAATLLTATEGRPFTAIVGTFTDANPNALPTQYAASINWGDGSFNTAGVIAKLASGAFTVTGSHTYAEESAMGSPYALTVTITTIGGTGSSPIMDIGTATVADAPLFSQGSPINGAEGIGLVPSLSTVATFTDEDPNGNTSDYTAFIDWGDGSAPSMGNIVQTGMSPNGSTFSVTGAHTYSEEGTYQTVVTITDVGGSNTVAVGSAVIADAPLTASSTQPAVDVTQNVPFTAPVAMFSDGNPNGTTSDFAATVDWGDGTPNSAGIISQPGGAGTAFVVTGSHTYAQGVFGTTVHDPIFVFVRDVGGSTVSIANTANIGAAPLVKVTAFSFDRSHGQIQVSFQDFPSASAPLALNDATLTDANNYHLTKFRQHGPAAFKVTSITLSPPNSSGAQTATLVINRGKSLPAGHYFIDIQSVSPTDRTGIQDVDGNALDGEFYGFFPSGNNVPGGDFMAQLDAVHGAITTPITVIGTAAPVSPPATLQSNTTIPTVNPGDRDAKLTGHPKPIAHHQKIGDRLTVHHKTVTAPVDKDPTVGDHHKIVTAHLHKGSTVGDHHKTVTAHVHKASTVGDHHKTVTAPVHKGPTVTVHDKTVTAPVHKRPTVAVHVKTLAASVPKSPKVAAHVNTVVASVPKSPKVAVHVAGKGLDRLMTGKHKQS
jgi:hypothetical protein